MKKIVLNATMMLLVAKSFCQTQDSTSKIKWGFNLGFNYSNLQIRNIDPTIQYSNSVGFRLGIIMDWKLTNRLSFSPKTEMSFSDSKIILSQNPDDKKFYQVYPALLDFASHLTYKLFNRTTTPYILFGPTYKVPITGDKNIQYATNRSDIALDFGIGLDKKLRKINIAPELRYSLGLNNLSCINGVGRLYFHTVTLILNFKG
jgi:hypothetical protein